MKGVGKFKHLEERKNILFLKIRRQFSFLFYGNDFFF